MQDFLYLKDYAAGNVHLIDIFVACSRYEADFWQMAWEPKAVADNTLNNVKNAPVEIHKRVLYSCLYLSRFLANSKLPKVAEPLFATAGRTINSSRSGVAT